MDALDILNILCFEILLEHTAIHLMSDTNTDELLIEMP